MSLNTPKQSNLKKYLWLLLGCCSVVTFAQSSYHSLTSEKWTFKKTTDFNWLPATVPGTVHTDLLNNKIIADPFWGSNENQLQWIEKEDWEYKTNFYLSDKQLTNEHCVLEFEGLDTYAKVFLNGQQILEADNMFRTWKVEVKKLLKKDSNELRIVFASAVKKGKEQADKRSYTLPGDEKVFTRKAQYHYGWDWGPRLVTSGIWKKVQLHFWNNATIKTTRCEQRALNQETAELDFQLVIEASKSAKYNIKLGNVSFERTLKKGTNTVSIPLKISKPILWWPNGLGAPHQYVFDFSLFHQQEKLEEKQIKIGLRTIELVQEKDSLGTSFYFKVNGVPVFMKGANYIPPDSFLPRVTQSGYKNIVKNAVDANMNMLRVWGGGVYADDAFYDECDANGILVWQDFMFACAMYPSDAAFLSTVKKEVVDNVSRLQNHPCIALWCGNNEIDEGWHNWGWQKQYNYTEADSAMIWKDYNKLFYEVIPQTLSSLLPANENRYWPSSPSIGWGKKESLLQGDSHYWGVWWGMEPFEVYEKKVGRFMSEYGFQGMPNLETFQSFAFKEDLNFYSDAVKNHQKHSTGYQTINDYMVRDYKVPKDFENYIYASQLLQAEGMKTAIEAHRRSKPNCMGTLYWQLNDCWPVTSWSSVDYFGRWKALQYQVKRSFENVLISVKETTTSYVIYVINDSLENFGGDFDFELMDFSGNSLWKNDVVAVVPANSSLSHFEIQKKDLQSFDLKKAVLSISLLCGSKTVRSLFYFAKPKDLQFAQPNVRMTKIDEMTYEITTDVLAKNVFLFSEQETFFSDNYFDILPNEKIKIKLTKPVQSIKIKSVFDTLP